MPDVATTLGPASGPVDLERFPCDNTGSHVEVIAVQQTEALGMYARQGREIEAREPREIDWILVMHPRRRISTAGEGVDVAIRGCLGGASMAGPRTRLGRAVSWTFPRFSLHGHRQDSQEGPRQKRGTRHRRAGFGPLPGRPRGIPPFPPKSSGLPVVR